MLRQTLTVMVLHAFMASHFPARRKKKLLLGQHSYEADYSFPNYRVVASTVVIGSTDSTLCNLFATHSR
jgi:hypothetical protein